MDGIHCFVPICVLFQKKNRLVSVRWICVACMNRAAHADNSHILHIVESRYFAFVRSAQIHKHALVCYGIEKEIKVKAFCVRVMCLITTCDFICNFCHHHNAHMKLKKNATKIPWKKKRKKKKNGWPSTHAHMTQALYTNGIRSIYIDPLRL